MFSCISMRMGYFSWVTCELVVLRDDRRNHVYKWLPTLLRPMLPILDCTFLQMTGLSLEAIFREWFYSDTHLDTPLSNNLI
jgi:hypothetical protein